MSACIDTLIVNEHQVTDLIQLSTLLDYLLQVCNKWFVREKVQIAPFTEREMREVWDDTRHTGIRTTKARPGAKKLTAKTDSQELGSDEDAESNSQSPGPSSFSTHSNPPMIDTKKCRAYYVVVP